MGKTKRRYERHVLREYSTIEMDLPKVGKRQVVKTTSVSDATEFLRAGMDVGAVGDSGAIVVWKTGTCWQCEFLQRQQVANSAEFKHLASVYEWLRSWWGMIR